MKLTLRQQITQFAHVLQDQLFPALQEATGDLDDAARRLVATLEMIPLARFVPASRGWTGRPPKDRLAMACAFVAKAVYGLGLTRQLLERLRQDAQLRRICGWEFAHQLPHESTFSRAFAEFAEMEFPQFVHEALIASTQKDRLIGHIARDSTAIEARERFPETVAQAAAKTSAPSPRRKPGRPKGKRGPHRRHRGGKPKHTPSTDTKLALIRQNPKPIPPPFHHYPFSPPTPAPETPLSRKSTSTPPPHARTEIGSGDPIAIRAGTLLRFSWQCGTPPL